MILKGRSHPQNTVHAQLLRFVMVGGIVFLTDVLFFLACFRALGINYLWANAVGKIVGGALGFILHKHITFSWRQRFAAKVQLLGYLGLFAANLVLANTLLYLAVATLPIPVFQSKILADLAVILTSFIASRSLVFSGSKTEGQGFEP